MKPYYQDDAVTIYHGDCREILPNLADDSVIISDPPYGIAAKLGMGGGKKGDGGMWKGVTIEGDLDTSARDEILTGFDDFAVFGSPRVPPPPGTKATLVWDKGEHTGAGDLSFPWKPCFELIFVAGRRWKSEHRGSAVIRVNAVAGCVGNANTGHRHHPFEKPVGIMTHLCAKTTCALIVDPFMGSGTTLRASKDLGRKAIGIEIEERYCEIAAKRMAQEVLAL
jgi:DNA modification methylase